MKTTKTLVFILLFSIPLSAQVKIDYSDPEEVAEKFLEYFYKGQWFDAAKYCGASDCQKQIEIMMTKMALDDVTQEEGKCVATVDSVKIDDSKIKGTIYFTKKCSASDKGEKKKLNIIKVDDKWLVEYVFKRDKYL
ncbi:MAG: hypothetical protein AB1695_07555 [Stygiobacter sp.]|jgi:hypothetical protein|uniref:DUF4878 domain-containing protein n=1 Tax=Stygiobacter electus TaxID=3032292 RepID=A0AAE3P2R2_9BACT|nr:hypothetical protein [Stygiobacter electus]MDF1612999.1 hypothetical protein [Stygiobacter electus]